MKKNDEKGEFFRLVGILIDNSVPKRIGNTTM